MFYRTCPTFYSSSSQGALRCKPIIRNNPEAEAFLFGNTEKAMSPLTSHDRSITHVSFPRQKPRWRREPLVLRGGARGWRLLEVLRGSRLPEWVSNAPQPQGRGAAAKGRSFRQVDLMKREKGDAILGWEFSLLLLRLFRNRMPGSLRTPFPSWISSPGIST